MNSLIGSKKTQNGKRKFPRKGRGFQAVSKRIRLSNIKTGSKFTGDPFDAESIQQFFDHHQKVNRTKMDEDVETLLHRLLNSETTQAGILQKIAELNIELQTLLTALSFWSENQQWLLRHQEQKKEHKVVQQFRQWKRLRRGKERDFLGFLKRKLGRLPIKIKKPSNIKNLNFDCLERIFSRLNATDLSNVADAHPQFVRAARFVFKRTYSEYWFTIEESCCVLYYRLTAEHIDFINTRSN